MTPPPVPWSAIAKTIPDLDRATATNSCPAPSMLMVLNQEDLTKETEQQNLPGSTWQYPNWRRKMRYRLEELATAPPVRDFVAMFRHWLEQSGR